MMVNKVYLLEVIEDREYAFMCTTLRFVLSDGVCIDVVLTDELLRSIKPEDRLDIYMSCFNHAAIGRYKMYANKDYIQKYKGAA